MANISLTHYTNKIFCFSPQVIYPDEITYSSVNNSVTKISRLGTFKQFVSNPIESQVNALVILTKAQNASVTLPSRAGNSSVI
jgi:hypothetical protein